MKFMTTEQLYNKFKNKELVQLSDLVQVIEDEFHVNVIIEENEDDIDLKEIAEDPNIVRQVKASREDRKAGRVYEQNDGLEYLRKRTQEFEREQNI